MTVSLQAIQHYLARLGFPIGATGPEGNGVDGLPGPKTIAALRAFRLIRGLVPLSDPEPAVLAALREEAERGRTIRALVLAAHGRGVNLPIMGAGAPADFVMTIFFHAIIEEAQRKVPAAITAAQAILESNYGQEAPRDIQTGRDSHNLFGIKGNGPAGSVRCYADEYTGGRPVRFLVSFRAYHNFLESIADHSALLLGAARYQELFATMNPETWAYGLQRAGYATDPAYAKKLIGLMRDWGLR